MKKIFFLSLTLLFFIPEILADKRAPRGECYISIGYVNDRAGVAEFAKNSFIKPENFELFERDDKKVYLTLGKIDENLFKKLQSQNKTYDFNCSRGKGYEERLGLNSDFQIIGGNKINIVSAEQFISVVSSIEIEKQRLVDLEVEKQVQARMAALEKERVAKEAAEKERQRLAELERKRKAEEEAEKERQRLAELERKRKAEEEAEKERLRLAELTRKRLEEEAAEKERARIAKQKADNEKALSLGFANSNEMKFANKFGIKNGAEFSKISNKLNSFIKDASLEIDEWVTLSNKIGLDAIIKKYDEFDPSDWPDQANDLYKNAINAPKLLLECRVVSGQMFNRGDTYFVSHSAKGTAEFLYVSKGNNHARENTYNKLGVSMRVDNKYYTYSNFKLNFGPSFVVRRNYKAYIERTSGNLYTSYEVKRPGSDPVKWDYTGSTLSCKPNDDHQKFILLRDDFIEWKKAKEKKEAEALKANTKF